MRPLARAAPGGQAAGMARHPSPLPRGEGLAERRIRVARSEVAWVRFILEAHDGLACMYGDDTDVLTLLTPTSQISELEGVITDLEAAVQLERLTGPCPPLEGK